MPDVVRNAGVIFILLALVVSALALAGCGGSDAGARIAGADARALVADGATLLDVRSDGEWAEGHLEGAVLIPIDQLAGRLAEIPRDRPVVVYCRSGSRSARGTALLREAGYDARDLGGMREWDR